MSYKESSQTKDADNVVRHFILAGLFLIDSIFKLIELVINPNRSNQEINNKGQRIKHIKNKLEQKTEAELREVLKDIEILEGFKKDELITLIVSTPLALSNLAIKERRNVLEKLTIPELKSLLRGTDKKITKLKKLELIELILSHENL